MDREKQKHDEEFKKFLEHVSFILGTTHGSITAILGSPDSELRPKLQSLWEKLNKEIGDLYYNQPTLPN